MHALGSALRTIGPVDALDIAVVSVFIYIILRLFEWTKAGAVARGILILGVLYAVARQLGMVLTTWFFHGFFAVFIIALVIIFQEELRRFFERLAVWNVRPHLPAFQSDTVDTLTRCITQCAHERTGALIVLCGRDPLERHLEGGFELDGKLSTALLFSIFDVHSDGHDGAVVIERDRLRKFGVHLPLSKNLDLLANLGTRHAAALGISEVTDALCVVVSEQRGTISLAQEGRLHPAADAQELERRIAAYLRGESHEPHRSRWVEWLTLHKKAKASSLLIALGLWLIFVQGFQPQTRSFDVALVAQRVPPDLRLVRISPQRVQVTLSGFKRVLDSIDPSRLHVQMNLEDQDPGRGRITIDEDDLRLPPSIRFLRADPPSVEVDIREAPH